MDVHQALTFIDSRIPSWGLRLKARSAAAFYYVRDADGWQRIIRSSVRRKSGESLSSMIVRLAEACRKAENSLGKQTRDERFASRLGIKLT